MTADSSDDKVQTATASAHHDGNAPVPTQKLPKGMVLGPDGKPCRTCSDLSSFTSVKKSALHTLSRSPNSTTSQPPLSSLTDDCPPDSRSLGRASWTLLHSIAAKYPTTPTTTEQADLSSFMRLFAKFYPCWYCAEDFQQYMAKAEVRVSSRAEFGMWLCGAHNEVNKKLGKKTFDCSKWEERWRDGWKDGRCDV